MQRKIPYYKSKSFLELKGNEIEDYDESLKAEGFDKKELFTPFFYVNKGNFFFTIDTFYNKETDTAIIEYWDHNLLLFQFATHNENVTFEVIKEFLSIAKDSAILEKTLKELYEKDE